MRSGNGRHRRPRQAPALLVTAGVTSAGIALPLLGATGAQAAGADTWDRVAACASGGVWSAEQAGQTAGGLAISLEDWVRYGGEVYASSPDLASRSQQIAVAERMLSQQGPEVWGACATEAGLAEDRATDPGVDPGVPLPPLLGGPESGEEGTEGTESAGDPEGSAEAPATGPGSDPDDESRPSAEATPRPGESGGTEPETDPSRSLHPSAPRDADRGSPEGTRGADGPAETGQTQEAQRPDGATGKHRGPRDPRDAAAERELERQRLVDRQRAQEGEAADRTARPDRYQVRTGDSLSAIAARYDLPGGWPALHAANQTVVGDDPDFILPGQLLDLDGTR